MVFNVVLCKQAMYLLNFKKIKSREPKTSLTSVVNVSCKSDFRRGILFLAMCSSGEAQNIRSMHYFKNTVKLIQVIIQYYLSDNHKDKVGHLPPPPL